MSFILFPAPNGQSIPCNVVQEDRGYRVEYSPSEVGMYCENLNNLDTKNIGVIILKFEQCGLTIQ